MTNLRGRYRILDKAFLLEKANRRDDPRHVFYHAILSNNSYEDYLSKVGAISVNVDTHPSGPITGRMEILYARRSGWISDA